MTESHWDQKWDPCPTIGRQILYPGPQNLWQIFLCDWFAVFTLYCHICCPARMSALKVLLTSRDLASAPTAAWPGRAVGAKSRMCRRDGNCLEEARCSPHPWAVRGQRNIRITGTVQTVLFSKKEQSPEAGEAAGAGKNCGGQAWALTQGTWERPQPAPGVNRHRQGSAGQGPPGVRAEKEQGRRGRVPTCGV